MNKTAVFKYFEKICKIPRGSGNMQKISDFCVSFAKENSLSWIQDEAKNVVIYKPAAKGYENSEPIILQGHLDMVCQSKGAFDFENEGIEIVYDGDFIKAKGTTLGADNGIAVAMIMAVLADREINAPAIEAVFTTDEEIGLIGAEKLSAQLLKSKRMINLDSEEMGVITVSCAGGREYEMIIPIERKSVCSTQISLSLSGLSGGHSGVEINKGRVNADILAGRILRYIKAFNNVEIISVDGGDKSNAIPCSAQIRFVTEKPEHVIGELEEYLRIVKQEIFAREKNFNWEIAQLKNGEYAVIDNPDKLIFALNCVPNGVVEMSASIENLVETSLNLGVLKTEKNSVTMIFGLRSNLSSSLDNLTERLNVFAKTGGFEVKTYGHYPPWEYNENSELQKLCEKVYEEMFSQKPRVEAIHAGLECASFSKKIKGFDCISIGPDLFDVHTVSERLSISSTEKVFELVIKILEQMQ